MNRTPKIEKFAYTICGILGDFNKVSRTRYKARRVLLYQSNRPCE